MARIFSWHIQDESKECFAYLAQSGSSGSYVAGSMVLDDKITDSAILNKIANKVSAYTESQYETQFNNMKTKVAQKGFTVQWKDYTYYYNVDGNNLIMLTGIGERGPQGPQGEQGQKGETGSAGKGRNIMCYCGLDSGITPTMANVSGGKFYPNVWDIEYPTDPRGVCTWQDSNEFGLGKIVWMTNADFPNATTDDPNEFVTPIIKIDKAGQSYTWATPIQISGPKGDNGADGDSIEFVYKRCETREDPVPEKPTGTTEQEAETQGWTDHPMGISLDYKVEYMCQHVKQNEVWGEWSDPVLWASWGEDGIDGDGIEYIFAVTQVYNNDAITRTVPNSGMTLALTNGGELRLADIWQEPEVYDYFTYCGVTKTNDGVTVDSNGKYFYGKTGPGDTRHASVYPWTDDPMDVSSGEPYEWVSIRRSKWDITNEHSVYGPFGEPTLWAHWGKDGEKGNDGTSVDIRGQADTLGKLLKSLGNNVPEVGFSYAIGVDGKRVYVWMEQDSNYQVDRTEYKPGQMPTEWYDKPDSEIYPNYYYLKDNKKYWFTDCGSFYGEPGKNAYVHEKYATDYTGQTGVYHRVTPVVFPDGTKDVDLCFTANNGETPGKYFATYTDNVYDDRGDLDFYDGKWVKWMGDDGQSFGQEQIFVRSMSKLDFRTFIKVATKNEHGYEIGEEYLNVTYTQDAFTTADWIPGNVGSYTFTDVPLGIVPGQYNFEYVCVRRIVQDGAKDDGTWSYFSVPALYNEAVDTPTFQVEYTKWTGTTKPVLTDANNYTINGVFDEVSWRNDNASTGPWSDNNDDDTTWMAQCNGYYKNSDETNLKWNDWIVFRCKGHDGARGNGRNVMAYCSLPTGYIPTQQNITGGKFYPNKWDISYPTDTVGINGDKGRKYCSWGDSNEPSDPSYMVWMTNADFPNSTGSSESESVDPIVKTDSTGGTYTWSIPVCITGEKGDNGADGDNIEFVYKRAHKRTDPAPARPTGTTEAEAEAQGWTDHPLGICEEYKVEYMSQHTKDPDTKQWGEFTEPALWASWGEDGIDGDGIEYIFATAATLDAGPTLFTKVPKQESFTEEVWQTPEIWDYIKEHHMESTYAPWTDDPSDVSPDEPYEFVSIRRRKYDDTEENAIFGPFEEPTLWAMWADDGDSIFTSFSFATLDAGTDISDCIVSGFTTGTTSNPSINPKWTKSGSTIITGIEWKDAPEQENSTQIIWMVSGVFKKHHNTKTGVDTYTQEQPWSEIQQMVDTADFEVIYCPDENPENPNIVPNFKKVGVNIDPNWLSAAAQIHWYDEVIDIPSSLGGAVWMATIKGHSNIWDKDNNGKDNWQVIKIKGESGSGGTSVSKFNSIIFKRTNTEPSTPTGGSYSDPLPSPRDNWEDTVPSGSSILWMSSRIFSSDGNNALSWSKPSQATDTEYIDYEWNKYWTTLSEAISNPPTKETPSANYSGPDANHWYDNPIQGAIFMAVRQVSNGQYVGNWEISKIKGEDGSGASGQTDLDYLKGIFPNVDASANTATLRGFLGVMSGDTDVVAFLNGGGDISDPNHGTVMIAAGVDSIAHAEDSKFVVFEDGTIRAKDAEIDGSITAETGYIGGIEIGTKDNKSGIRASDENGYGFELTSNGDVNINNKNVQINNDGIVFKDNNGDDVLSVVNKAYHSLQDFVNSMSGGVKKYGGRMPIFQHETFETATTVNFNYGSSEPVIINDTTFTVTEGTKNKVTIFLQSLVLAAVVRASSLTFGSGSLSWVVDIVLADENNNPVATFFKNIGTETNGTSKVFFTTGRTFTTTVGPGTYHLQLQNMTVNGVGVVSGQIPSGGFEWETHLELNAGGPGDVLIDSIPLNSGVEIFRNGMAIRNSEQNYLFAASPDAGQPESLIFAIMSNGRGKCFSGGTWTDIIA